MTDLLTRGDEGQAQAPRPALEKPLGRSSDSFVPYDHMPATKMSAIKGVIFAVVFIAISTGGMMLLIQMASAAPSSGCGGG